MITHRFHLFSKPLADGTLLPVGTQTVEEGSRFVRHSSFRLMRPSLLAAAVLLSPTASSADAEDFKSSKFLTYPADSQKSYIGTAVVAATTIASLNSVSQAKCLGSWITKHSGGGYETIMEAMRKYPDDHPMGLILAVLQRDCGPLKYVK